jgi:P pilus assembly chaperone PapD
MKNRYAGIASGMLFAAMLLLVETQATAATFSINPTRVELDAKHRSDIITVYNSGDATLRLQVRSMRWQMRGDGQWKLDPTDDLIVTPELAEVAPGKTVELRVGSLQAVDSTEASYRLLLNELPGLANDPSSKSGQIRVLTEINLPVFLEPEHVQRKPVLRSGSIDASKLSLGVGNDGNHCAVPAFCSWRHGSVQQNAAGFLRQRQLLRHRLRAGARYAHSVGRRGA